MGKIAPAFCSLTATLFLSCLNTDGIAEHCGGKDLDQLKSQNSISQECKDAINDLLPSPENNLSGAFLSLGSGTFSQKTVLFLGATDSGGSPLSLTRSSQVKVTASTAKGDSVLDTARYTMKKFKSVAGAGISLSSIIDYSASMSDQDIADAAEIYSDFYGVLKATPVPFESNVFFFSDSVKKIGDFSSLADTLQKRVQPSASFTRQSTALYDAIGKGLESLAARNSPIKLLIVATDGLENSSQKYLTRDTLYSLAKARHVRVVVLGSLFSDLSFLKGMASQTGGLYVYSKTVLRLKAEFLKTADALANATAIQLNGFPAGTTSIKVEYGGKSASFAL